MKKRRIALVLSLFVMLGGMTLFSGVYAATSTWDGTIPTTNTSYNFSGSGTEADPWLIQSAADLAQFAANINGGDTYAGKHFKLTVDVDLASKEWVPIGGGETALYYFSGVFDGDYHVVKNLMINLPDKQNVGFFGAVNGATIKNFGIESGSITGGGRTGGIAGYSFGEGSTYYNCFNMSSLISDVVALTSGTNDIGGICAVTENNTPIAFAYCYNGGNMTAKGRPNSTTRVGGIVGYSVISGTSTAERFMDNCYNEGNILVEDGRPTDASRIGGLAGSFMQYSTITNSGSSGTIEVRIVSSEVRVGVLVGSFTQESTEEAPRVFTVENNKAVAITGLEDVAFGAGLNTTYVTTLNVPFASSGSKFLVAGSGSSTDDTTTASTTTSGSPTTSDVIGVAFIMAALAVATTTTINIVRRRKGHVA